VLTPGPGGEGTWKWMRPLPDILLVNVADALEFVFKGFMKSCVYRARNIKSGEIIPDSLIALTGLFRDGKF
jgi:isopenicillin N synthase-like dioxygenase